jgi:hypothetical protein
VVDREAIRELKAAVRSPPYCRAFAVNAGLRNAVDVGEKWGRVADELRFDGTDEMRGEL